MSSTRSAPADPSKQTRFFECWPAPKPDAPASAGGKVLAHVLHEDWFKWSRVEQAEFVKTEVLLGITICFAQVPESVAFAFMAHIKPPVALHAAWIVGLICTLLGGRSGMVNGAEGAFAAIISTMVAAPENKGDNGEGIELLFPSVMCAGAFMLLIWAVRGDRCALRAARHTRHASASRRARARSLGRVAFSRISLSPPAPPALHPLLPVPPQSSR
jgi:hypothetical protein